MPALILPSPARVEFKFTIHATDEPIFVTKNGYGDMVIMSIAAYENHIARMKIYDKIMQGAQQAEEGKLIDGDSAMASLRSKYVR